MTSRNAVLVVAKPLLRHLPHTQRPAIFAVAHRTSDLSRYIGLCHTTLSRRSGSFAARRPNAIAHGARHLIVDSTWLKLFGQGEWNEERHGRNCRSWRKLYLAGAAAARSGLAPRSHQGLDACTGEIVARALTEKGAYDAGEVPGLLEQIDGEIANFICM